MRALPPQALDEDSGKGVIAPIRPVHSARASSALNKVSWSMADRTFAGSLFTCPEEFNTLETLDMLL
jgi:hypothetical protein